VREARLATSEETVPARERDGAVEAMVSRLDDHEIVVFEMK
jgi:hypothetical protein